MADLSPEAVNGFKFSSQHCQNGSEFAICAWSKYLETRNMSKLAIDIRSIKDWPFNWREVKDQIVV